jgi:hypothetical protein
MKNRKIRLFLISAVILAFLFNAGVFAESSEILIPEMLSMAT